MSFLSRLFRPLAACAIGVLATAGAAFAEPGLWVVKDKDSTIYLFGTVHMLKPDTVWRSPKIDKAIASAGEVWLEIPSTDPAAMAAQLLPLMSKYGMAQGTKISEQLSAEEYATLTEAAKLAGLPPAMLDQIRPWFAAVGISSASFQAAGYDPNSGVDTKIEAIFKAREITPKGLETVEDQLMVFATMAPDVELEFLKSTLKEFKEAPTELNKMVDSWAAGDTASLEKLFVTEMKDEDKGLYQRLLVDRNTKWAGEIKEMLKGKGVTFIAVGAGHLVGPDSVQVQLKKLGVESKRQ
jgi:uncharacterized protein YbaP (TraB family)